MVTERSVTSVSNETAVFSGASFFAAPSVIPRDPKSDSLFGIAQSAGSQSSLQVSGLTGFSSYAFWLTLYTLLHPPEEDAIVFLVPQTVKIRKIDEFSGLIYLRSLSAGVLKSRILIASTGTMRLRSRYVHE